jgi:hypothetical protein
VRFISDARYSLNGPLRVIGGLFGKATNVCFRQQRTFARLAGRLCVTATRDQAGPR